MTDSAPPAAAVAAAAAASMSANTHPPIVHTLDTLHADTKEAQERYDSLLESFASLYGAPAEFVARAPGRVNLIGEHIDYNGFGVLPMALERDTLIAGRICRAPAGAAVASTQLSATSDGAALAARQSSLVEVRNSDSETYPGAVFSVHDRDEPNSPPSLFDILPLATAAAASAGGGAESSGATAATAAQRPDWTRYVQCGMKGVWESVQAARTPGSGSDAPAALHQFSGMQLLLEGNVPPAAGLSSSSSLVCCAALAAAYAVERASSPADPSVAAAATSASGAASLSSFSKLSLSSHCAHSERHVGTAGGGMDQAASFLGQRGYAMHVDFSPVLRCGPVPLPSGAMILVANTCAPAEKARSAATHFNRRVLECTLAAHVLAKQLRLDPYAYSTAAAASALAPDAASASASASHSPDGASQLTLHDVLESSGKTLAEMVSLLSPSSSPSPSAPALHPAPYTLPELLELFGTDSLRPLLAFRPQLADALGEEEYFAAVKARSSARAAAATATAPAQVPAATAAAAAVAKPRVRVAFGRTVAPSAPKPPAAAAATSYLDDDEDDDPFQRLHARAAAAAAAAAAVAASNTAPQSARDRPFPWELQAAMERKAALHGVVAPENPPSAATSSEPLNDALAATAAPASSTPYRLQGDPEQSGPEQTSSRSSLSRDPRVVKCINRFWVMLPKHRGGNGTAGGVGSGTPAGELSKEEYCTFFLRICRLLNPDLEFDAAWVLVQADWERDVARTRASVPETASSSRAKSVATGDKTKGTSGAAAAAAGGAADLASIPYSTFFASMFELVDLWCADSNAASYAELLDLLHQKLTVRVESRGGAVAPPASSTAPPTPAAPRAPEYPLLQRALHVYSEALRVEEFAALCAGGGAVGGAPTQVLPRLGAIMSASHASCAGDYACSCEELDALVDVCVSKAGAVGARLTGAGWGGCVVALFDASTLAPEGSSGASAAAARSASIDRILDIIISEYYVKQRKMTDREAHRDNFKDLLFVTEPAAGAAVYLPPAPTRQS